MKKLNIDIYVYIYKQCYWGVKEKRYVYGTWYSQAVTHPNTNQARRCLTSVIGREPVLSTWYGRRHLVRERQTYLYIQTRPVLNNLLV